MLSFIFGLRLRSLKRLAKELLHALCCLLFSDSDSESEKVSGERRFIIGQHCEVNEHPTLYTILLRAPPSPPPIKDYTPLPTPVKKAGESIFTIAQHCEVNEHPTQFCYVRHHRHHRLYPPPNTATSCRSVDYFWIFCCAWCERVTDAVYAVTEQ